MKGALCQFTSKTSSAGIVNAMLGFIPDVAVVILAHGATNPNILIWCNNDKASAWAAALALLITGSTGVVTRSTSAFTAYAGGDVIATTETTDTAGKHVNLAGLASTAGTVTAPGIAIPAALQTAGAANIVIGLQLDAVPSMQPAS